VICFVRASAVAAARAEVGICLCQRCGSLPGMKAYIRPRECERSRYIRPAETILRHGTYWSGIGAGSMSPMYRLFESWKTQESALRLGQ